MGIGTFVGVLFPKHWNLDQHIPHTTLVIQTGRFRRSAWEHGGYMVLHSVFVGYMALTSVFGRWRLVNKYVLGGHYYSY